MSRITNDTLDLGELYHHGPEDLAIAVLKFAGVIALLAHLDIPLTLLIVAFTPLAIAYALHFNRRMNRAQRLSKDRIGAINERVEDALAGIRVVQSFANEELENQRFEEDNRRFLESRRAGYRSEAFFGIGMDAFAQVITVLIIVAGAVRVVRGHLTVADMLTFLLCVTVLIDPVHRLANLARLWQQGFTGFTRVMEILELAPGVPGGPPHRVVRRTGRQSASPSCPAWAWTTCSPGTTELGPSSGRPRCQVVRGQGSRRPAPEASSRNNQSRARR